MISLYRACEDLSQNRPNYFHDTKTTQSSIRSKHYPQNIHKENLETHHNMRVFGSFPRTILYIRDTFQQRSAGYPDKYFR